MAAREGFNRIADTRYGRLIYNRHDVRIGESIELYGEYAEREIVVLDQIVRAGDVVLDVGANVGPHTLFLAKKVGPQGRVFAFEPLRIPFQALCGNMALNSITNVWCWNVAAGARAGEFVVPAIDYDRPHQFDGVTPSHDGVGERVPVVTIDSLNLPRCDFLKLSTEGMQAEVLDGAAGTIARLKPALYVTCSEQEADGLLLRQLHALGYSMHWHFAPLFNADNFARNDENMFGGKASKNLLCIDRAAPSRLTGFTRVQIGKAA